MPRVLNPINAYLSATMAYGLCHATSRVSGRTHEYVRNRPVDALLVDKFAYCLHTAAMAPILWPFYCYRDARWLELRARGKRSDEYPEGFDFP